MGTLARNSKSSSGTTDFLSGTTAIADEVDADFDTLYTGVNGNIEDVNVKAAADIDPSKIGDYSATDAESRVETAPGTTASPEKATTLEAELARLRYVASRANVGVAPQYLAADDSTLVDASWMEPPIVGRNLVQNANFTQTNLVSGDSPFFWAEIGTLLTSTLQSTENSEGDGFECSLVADGAAVAGISQTIIGIKGSSKYLVGFRIKSVVNDATVFVAGGLGSGNAYQDFSIDTSSTDYVTISGIVQSTAAGASLVISCQTAGATNDAIDVDHAFVYELADDPVATFQTQCFEDRVTAAQTIDPGADSWEAISGMSLSCVKSSNVDVVQCEVHISAAGPPGDEGIGARIKENGVVVCTVVMSTMGGSMKYTNATSAPGTELVYTAEMYQLVSSYDITPDDLIGADAAANLGQTESTMTLTTY